MFYVSGRRVGRTAASMHGQTATSTAAMHWLKFHHCEINVVFCVVGAKCRIVHIYLAKNAHSARIAGLHPPILRDLLTYND
ncbi:hypothetical protein KB879_38740 (plasmid) [Cupriavidus sp. KK10]|uniref:hypothetical protein n=1 Tax=Cupriavidus sp. KK10 TaxID=1478019 RepID=UPI001BAB6456|nr:hypothetical protein [Cupriavidus sp. KK10]QUN32152.1 hypothetical protein KB879_38740 [Cupriavidus sp. KK10]